MATKYPENRKNQVKVGKVTVPVVQMVLRSGRENIFLSTSSLVKTQGFDQQGCREGKSNTRLRRVCPAANILHLISTKRLRSYRRKPF